VIKDDPLALALQALEELEDEADSKSADSVISAKGVISPADRPDTPRESPVNTDKTDEIQTKPVAGTCRRCGEPAASNLLYNCEACADELHANRRPLKETDPEGYQRAVAWLERQRDEKAAWLTEAEQVLAGLAADDPRRELGMAKWWEGLRAYEQMCKAILEPAAEHCLDCGRPSPRGLTPCDGCVHQGRHR
jgi:hypothetical protein